MTTLQMFTDACCTRAGWLEYYAAGGGYDLHVSIPADADLDGVVRAFDHDEQEMITLNGWLFNFVEVVE